MGIEHLHQLDLHRGKRRQPTADSGSEQRPAVGRQRQALLQPGNGVAEQKAATILTTNVGQGQRRRRRQGLRQRRAAAYRSLHQRRSRRARGDRAREICSRGSFRVGDSGERSHQPFVLRRFERRCLYLRASSEAREDSWRRDGMMRAMAARASDGRWGERPVELLQVLLALRHEQPARQRARVHPLDRGSARRGARAPMRDEARRRPRAPEPRRPPRRRRLLAAAVPAGARRCDRRGRRVDASAVRGRGPRRRRLGPRRARHERRRRDDARRLPARQGEGGRLAAARRRDLLRPRRRGGGQQPWRSAARRRESRAVRGGALRDRRVRRLHDGGRREAPVPGHGRREAGPVAAHHVPRSQPATVRCRFAAVRSASSAGCSRVSTATGCRST